MKDLAFSHRQSLYLTLLPTKLNVTESSQDLGIKEKVKRRDYHVLLSTFIKSSLFFIVCVYSLNNLLLGAYLHAAVSSRDTTANKM